MSSFEADFLPTVEYDAAEILDQMSDTERSTIATYFALQTCRYISGRAVALENISEWREAYEEDHGLEYSEKEAAAWEAGMQFGNDTAAEYMIDLLSSNQEMLLE